MICGACKGSGLAGSINARPAPVRLVERHTCDACGTVTTIPPDVARAFELDACPQCGAPLARARAKK